MADSTQRQIGSGVAAVVSVVDGKAAVVVSVSDDLKDKVDFAQGGGPDGDRAAAALAAIQRALASQPAAAE